MHNIHPLLFHGSLKKKKNEPCIQGDKRNIPKMFQIVWEPIHPFHRNVAIRHTAAPRWEALKHNILVRHETV